MWPHEVEPWFHSWYRGRVETLDAKYNLAYSNSTLCDHTNSLKRATAIAYSHIGPVPCSCFLVELFLSRCVLLDVVRGCHALSHAGGSLLETIKEMVVLLNPGMG